MHFVAKDNVDIEIFPVKSTVQAYSLDFSSPQKPADPKQKLKRFTLFADRLT